MQLQNKNRIAYLGALTLLFSYAEMLLPRIVPFFRLGLGNITILLALNLPFPDFLVLTIIKSLASSLMSGTLISPFFLISISQSVISGIVMFVFFRIKGKWITLYGISMIGSAISGIIQLLLSTIYLGTSTFNLLGPMLLFSIFAGLITAFLSQILKLPDEAPKLISNSDNEGSKTAIFLVILIIAVLIVCFMIHNLWILTGALAISLILQKICGRKILLIPHVSMWIFVLFISLLTPNGKVLIKIANFSITQGALLEGYEKALKLSIAAALSQCATTLKPPANSLLGMTLAFYGGLSNKFRNSNGKLIKRLQETLEAAEL